MNKKILIIIIIIVLLSVLFLFLALANDSNDNNENNSFNNSTNKTKYYVPVNKSYNNSTVKYNVSTRNYEVIQNLPDKELTLEELKVKYPSLSEKRIEEMYYELKTEKETYTYETYKTPSYQQERTYVYYYYY
ncbi:hypothetical protein [Methanobrevibacter sp. DSM 116169]|uniref:hypothetical protein n=1 Tax=Methanobrevibacter sp. DSM 116169 TaxID=3242727 RepID=UPI0038FC6587